MILKREKTRLLFVMLFVFMIFPSTANGASATPSVDFTVTPSQSVIVKPATGPASGGLDIRLTPEGKATNANRTPIDVVFIFDKSGSMDELGSNPYKFLSAKYALKEAVDYFSIDPNKDDQYAFIPFSSDVEYSKAVNLPVVSTPTVNSVKANLNMIYQKAHNLTAEGGTNYTQSFQFANSILTSGNRSSNKYIFFLTDGEPTVSQIEVESNSKKTTTETYTIYTNNTASFEKRTGNGNNNTSSTRIPVETAETTIKSHIQTEVNKLAANNIKLYSIGFGSNREVDMDYLSKLSETTGVTAQQASTDTIATIFEGISEKMATPTITATVKVNISKFGGKVQLADNANATTDSSGNIIIKKDILFPINQNITSPIDISLPLTFNSSGTYEFDDIKLEYRDLDGILKEKSASTTIVVKEDAPATFQSKMTLNKEVNELNNLIKTSNSSDKTNYYNVQYILNPTGLVNNSVTGKLTNLVIEQPIPDGVSLIPTSYAKEETKEDGKYAVITLPESVSYSGGRFSVSDITKIVQFKVDYAVQNITMPRANLVFNDTRFSDRKKVSIPASTQTVTMKVQLKDPSIIRYTGDAAGTIEKRDIATNSKLAASEFPNDYGLSNKAVKDMVFEEGSAQNAIKITYFDDAVAYLYMVPDFDLIGQTTENKYVNDETSSENINAKVTNLVAGNDVEYSYRLENESDTTSWTKFDPNNPISLSEVGLNTISIKAAGGFANDVEVTKKITIQRIIQSITIQPNPIEIAVGKSVDFTIDIKPDEAAANSLDIRIKDPFVGSLVVGDNKIIGIKVGTTELIVKTNDGSNMEVRVPVKVVDPYVALEEIKFRNPVYKVEISQDEDDLLAVEDLLIFNPSNATDKELESVESSMPDKVEIVEIDGEYYVKGVEVGYSTVTATAEEQKDGKKPTDSALFEVVKDGEADDDETDSDSSDNGEGRW